MGLSSSKTTTSSAPVFKPELTAASGAVTDVYHQNQGAAQANADQINSLVPDLLDKYRAGNPAVNAQQSYITNMLSGDPGHNPQLDAMLAQSNDNVANTTNAHLGTRGLTGGTVQNDILSRNLAQNDTAMRYQDYNTQQQLRAQAAGMAPGNAAAQVIGISPLLAAAQAGSSIPMDQATKYAASIGGLLGQYQNTTTKTSPNILQMLLAGASNAASAFAGGA